MNLRRWSIQSNAKCSLCNSLRPTTAHVLSGCPVALSQHRFTYRHDLVLHSLVTSFVEVFVDLPFVQIYTDLPSSRASDSPLATIPTTVMVTPYRPDIVIYNTINSSLLLFELTCPLDSNHHLSQAWSHKQSKVEYQQILAELDRLGISNYYEIIEISVLDHYQQFSIKNTCPLCLLRIALYMEVISKTDSGQCLKGFHLCIPENFYGKGLQSGFALLRTYLNILYSVYKYCSLILCKKYYVLYLFCITLPCPH